MKKILNVAGFLCVLFLLFNSSAYGGEYLSSKTLNIKDVEPFVKIRIQKMSTKYKLLGNVYGIYQDGNAATIFYYRKKPDGSKTRDKIRILRLNSGKWFHPDSYTFVPSK